MGLFSFLARLFGGGRKSEPTSPAAAAPIKRQVLTAKHYQEDIASGFTEKEDELPTESAPGLEGIVIADDDAWMEDEVTHTDIPVPLPRSSATSAFVPVLVADLDGTLMGDPTSKYRKQFLPQFVERVRQLQETHNFVFVLNSGATYDRILQTLEAQPDPVWPDHLLLRESEIYHLVEPGRYVEHQPYNDQSRKLRSDSINAIKPLVTQWYEEWAKAVQIVRWQVQKYEVVVMLPDSDQANLLRDIVRKQLRFTKDVSVMSNRRVVAITSNLFNKRVVLDELLRYRKWEPRQVVAMGDDVNDLPILDGRLAYPTCPSNAVEAVKESVLTAGGFVSEYGFGEGALDALEVFLEQFEASRSRQ